MGKYTQEDRVNAILYIQGLLQEGRITPDEFEHKLNRIKERIPE